MTKDREHDAKSHQSKAKEKTKHEEVREAHIEEKVESQPTAEAPEKKGHEEANAATAPIQMDATSSSEDKPLTVELDGEIQEKIRVRAFAIFEQSGRVEGRDLENWLQAEAELTSERWKVLAA